MPPPRTPSEARRWIREALQQGLFTPSVHFKQRLVEREIDMLDVHAAIGRCSSVEPHTDMPRNGGSCWRIEGPDADGARTVAVGAEAFEKDGQRRVMLCTVFSVERRS